MDDFELPPEMRQYIKDNFGIYFNTFREFVNYNYPVSPETAKLRAAIAMKKAEMGNYAQKFILPSAKLSLEFSKQFDRDLPYESSGHYPAAGYYPTQYGPYYTSGPYFGLYENSTRVMIAAQWKPIEGGH